MLNKPFYFKILLNLRCNKKGVILSKKLLIIFNFLGESAFQLELVIEVLNYSLSQQDTAPA